MKPSATSPALLDGERRARLERIAALHRTTVSSLLQEAIDATLPVPEGVPRLAAGRFLLDAPPMAVPADWMQLRRDTVDGPS